MKIAAYTSNGRAHQDVEDINRPVQDLVHAADRIQQLAADACPCHRTRT